ncbi:MAG: site-specific DNA-methyltransferase [Acidimicrobiales bacterium]
MTEPYYSDPWVTIYHGDCLDILPGLDADVMVTDPPYGMGHSAGGGRPKRPIIGDESSNVRDEILSRWDGPALVFGRWNIPHPESAWLCLTWDKGDWPGTGDLNEPWGMSTEEIYVIGKGFVGRRTGTVLRHDRITRVAGPNPAKWPHPTEKPLSLIADLVSKCPVGVVLDPFMGSGTTLRAAKNLGRRAIGIEIEERYCEIAAKRMGQEVLPI